jgi:hypothetical protein
MFDAIKQGELKNGPGIVTKRVDWASVIRALLRGQR